MDPIGLLNRAKSAATIRAKICVALHPSRRVCQVCQIAKNALWANLGAIGAIL